MEEQILITLVMIITLGIAAQWLAWWLKLPSILFLLLFGVLAGPVFHLFSPDELLGDLLFPTVSLGVALVLFEGALTLKFSEIRGHGRVVFNLVSWGATLSWLLMAVGVWWFAEFSWSIALLFAALVVVTGPTVIMPLLRNVRPSQNVSQVLRWEGILIDPIGAIFAVLVFELIISDFRGSSYWVLLLELATGVLAGAIGAIVLSFMLSRHLIPEYLQNVFTLALVLAVFTASNHFAEESGLLAVTVMGVWLANTRSVDMDEILLFKESLSLLIVSVLFIVLAARIDLVAFFSAGWTAVVVLAVVLLARPVVVVLSTLSSGLSWQDKALISWIAPRGIVAAAISSLFAIKLTELGVDGASQLAPMTFMVIVATVLLQSFTARPMAKLLGVAEEEPKGVLIIGANNVAIAIGKALQQQGFRVKLTSSSWSEIQAARMEGLETYFGNPVSVHADNHLDLIGIGRLFALSRRPALNTLACLKFRNEFGRQRVFTLRNAEEKDDSDKGRVTDSYHAPRLFGEDITMQKLASLIGQGAEIKATKLSDSFSPDMYLEKYGSQMTPLFYLDEKGRLRAYTDKHAPDMKVDQTIISLVQEQEVQ